MSSEGCNIPTTPGAPSRPAGAAPPTARQHIARHFRGRVPEHGTRAASYYWERKRWLVLDLIASHLGELRASAPAGKRPLLVDVGCGDGTDLFMTADYLNSAGPGWRFLGLDGLASALATANERNATYGIKGVEIRPANITRPLPLGDGSVDVLYCSEVLEHMPEPAGMLREFARVLRAGGFCLITTPNEPNIFQRSWWSRSHYQSLLAKVNPVAYGQVEVNGEVIDLYGHISLHTNREWDRMFAEHGMPRVDFRRGAAVYGNRPLYGTPVVHHARKLADWVLDLLPRNWSRSLSDQMIALYRRT
ncbi:MAG TPA: class I SAM-dependent methyltransferase [Tepidisphaeraceae bacterium]